MKLQRAGMTQALLTGPDGVAARYSYFYCNSRVECFPDGQRRDIADSGWVPTEQGVLTDRTHNRLLWRSSQLMRQGVDVVFDFGEPVVVNRVVVDAAMPADIFYTLDEVALSTAVSDVARCEPVACFTRCASRPIVFDGVGRVARYVKVHLRPPRGSALLLTGIDVYGSAIETVNIKPDDWVVYPTPRAMVRRSGRFRLAGACLKMAGNVPADQTLHDLYTTRLGLSQRGSRHLELRRARMPAEHYRLKIGPDRARVEAPDLRGFVWALQSLLCLRDGGASLPCAKIEDGPASRLRGVHLYLPSRANLDFARQFIDEVVVRSKLNTIFFELGGGMEFKRHPEINQGWVDFCRRQVELQGRWPEGVGESPYRTTRNSLHVELAGGEYLSQQEVRELVAFARSRGLEVIPEVQSLSHSYWLLQRHRELAEYPLGIFPFTYCPSNPKTYELLFDCLDEVIDVFRPRRVHIGHDEIYELAQCPRCRGRRGADLLAEDVTRIHGYLGNRGIGVMMWGDSMVTRHNGLEKRTHQVWDKIHRDTVATYQAIDLIPRDISILNWSWGLDRDSKTHFMNRGLAHLYGNLHALRIGDWPSPRTNKLDLGGEVSTWVGLSEDELGFDGLFHRIILAGQVLWGPWQHEQLPLHEVVASDRVAVLRTILANRKQAASQVSFKPVALPKRSRCDLGFDLLYGDADRVGPVPFEPDFGRPIRLAPGQRVRLTAGVRASGVHLLAACRQPETYHTTADTYGQPVSLEMGRAVIHFADGERIEQVLRYGVHVAGLWEHPLFGGPWCYRAEPTYRSARSILYATQVSWSRGRQVRRIELHGTREPLDNALLLFAATLAV